MPRSDIRDGAVCSVKGPVLEITRAEGVEVLDFGDGEGNIFHEKPMVSVWCGNDGIGREGMWKGGNR